MITEDERTFIDGCLESIKRGKPCRVAINEQLLMGDVSKFDNTVKRIAGLIVSGVAPTERLLPSENYLHLLDVLPRDVVVKIWEKAITKLDSES